MRDAVYVQNYVPGFWDHTWSLAVEEHFYFLLAAGIALAVRRREPLRYLPHLVIAVGFVALAARVHAAVAWGERSYTTGPTHARIDTLAWGVALAYFVECRGWRPPAWLLWVGIAAFIPWAVVDARGSFFLATGGLTVVGLGSAALVAGSLRRQASSAPLRAIAFVGRYSYGIYLWHLVTRSFVHGMIGPLPRAWWYVGLGAYLAVAIAFGCLVSLGIERPALRWRDRILPALGNPEEKLGLIAPPAHAGPAPRLEASA
jgi:peptidoglycan/LPS O-acetylase OafA/YrhL